MKLRKEFDSIGSINVPNDKYWGASTQRSKKYFDIGEFLVRPVLIKSIAIIKKAAAIVHSKEKQILPHISKAIIKISCRECDEPYLAKGWSRFTSGIVLRDGASSSRHERSGTRRNNTNDDSDSAKGE